MVIAPRPRWCLPELNELLDAREVLYRFAQRDITLRYRQTALGVVWVVLQPLLGAGVLSFVFGRVARLSTNGVPVLLYTFAGMTAWNVFSGVTNRGSTSLVSHSGLLAKLYFPRILIPLSTAGAAVCDFGVSVCFLGILMAIYGVAPGPAILLTPLWLLLTLALAAGIGLTASSLIARYRDIGYVVPFVLQILLFASPVAYSVAATPVKYHTFFAVNPMTWLLEGMRWSLIGQPRPSALYLCLSATVPLTALLTGCVFFQSRERSLADLI